MTSIQKLFDERDDKYAAAASSVEHATAGMIQKLSAIKPPDAARGEHGRLAAEFRSHLRHSASSTPRYWQQIPIV
ncbi:MAG: hypothetical protein ACRDNK_01485 [Solirubrobacteraceae bacterium]